MSKLDFGSEKVVDKLGKVQIGSSLEKFFIEWLDDLAEDLGISRSRLIRSCIIYSVLDKNIDEFQEFTKALY